MEFSPSLGLQVEADMKYIDSGDPVTPHFTIADITIDDDWHDLDLSGIVDAASAGKQVHLKVNISGNAVEPKNHIFLRRKGNTHEVNSLHQFTQVADRLISQDGLVTMDADRKIEYRVMGIPADWTIIFIIVRGWWV